MKESKHSGMQLGRDAVHHRGEEVIDPPAVHSVQWSGPKEERGIGGRWDPTKEQTQTHWDLAKSFRQQLPNPLFTKIQPLWLESILELPPERYLAGNSFFLLVGLFELDWSFLPEKGDAYRVLWCWKIYPASPMALLWFTAALHHHQYPSHLGIIQNILKMDSLLKLTK